MIYAEGGRAGWMASSPPSALVYTVACAYIWAGIGRRKAQSTFILQVTPTLTVC